MVDPHLLFIAPRSAQVLAPVFKNLTATGNARVSVAFWRPRENWEEHDPELGLAPRWQIDLVEGFDHFFIDGMPGLLRSARSTDYDLVILPGWVRINSLIALASAFSARRRVGIVSDVVSFEARHGFKQWVRRSLVRSVSRIAPIGIAASSLAATELATLGWSRENIFVIPYMVDTAFVSERFEDGRRRRTETRRDLGVADDEPIVLAVMKLVEREGAVQLLRAVDAEGLAGARLVVVGDGPMRKEFESHPGVTLLGYRPYPELFRYYAAADLFLHPALYESWGISVVEAMLCELPIVVSDGVGAGFDLVVPGESGSMYPRESPAALRRAVADLLHLAPVERQDMGRRASSFARRFNDEDWKLDYARLVERLRN